MASGKTHDKITKLMSPFVLIIFFIINNYLLNDITHSIILTILSVSIYIFAGYMFSGDLDTKSREFNRWGLLKFIWIPYQKLFRHRSIYTHGFLFGPLIRILYIYIIFLTVSSFMFSLTIISFSTFDLIYSTLLFFLKNKLLILNIFLALFLGSGLHTLIDLLSSTFKKHFKKRKRYYNRQKNNQHKRRMA